MIHFHIFQRWSYTKFNFIWNSRKHFTSFSDINECSEGTHKCDPHAECANIFADHVCTCNQGYSGDGETCVDIDECLEGNKL